ncbi:MAG: glutamine synthetase III [Gemmatimonadetes bacterium]|nr:glutamine synthetase III [Gemmatimonadota bacterium]MCC6769574.1 glutamine synthetase III [Gemmatimonadaceae bacterium]
MPSSTNSARKAALAAIASRNAKAAPSPNGDKASISEIFGINTFGTRQMRSRLPQDVYARLSDSIRLGGKLDEDIAPTVAQAIRDWAVSRGATHFTHWFLPQTGLTAEKHDAFLTFDENKHVIEQFSASQLIQSEPDASSFPSGGLRATWEARGYTAWNPASPVFIIESGNVRTLCIPSVFIGYNGEALDEMTPLLRSSDVLSEKAIALLTLLGDKGVQRVFTTLGPEQEYFLIDRTHFAMRPDLVMSNRTLIGAPPPRGQQLEDHYFGGIPERIQACIAEVEHELYKLGVPIMTRHNEVAPCQFEMAPFYEETEIAVDHNQLVMSVLRRVAMRHGLQAIVHEKPFDGVNGSGKHCNWAMAITSKNELDGINLLKPGRTPHQNIRFLVFLAAVLRGVHKHAGLLRAGIATSGNEHRLGANEAPPAIISVFMGKSLTRVIEEIASGKVTEESAEQQVISLGVSKLPEIERDNTDRNRTSPFAFTGNKFEFRAVGSSQSIAFPVTLLNAAVAEAIADITEMIKAERKESKTIDDAVMKVLRKVFRDTRHVRFEGNNYSDAWVQEAAKRGLLNLRRAPDALGQLVVKRSRDLFIPLGILSKEELESRYHVRLERYVKDVLIEMHTLREMIDTLVLPAAYEYLGSLASSAAQAKVAGIKEIPHVERANEVGALARQLKAKRELMHKLVGKAETMHDDPAACAALLTSDGAARMAEVRAASDALELLVGDEYWPLPKYREMLFPV